MGLTEWAKDSVQNIRREPVRGINLSAKRFAAGIVRKTRNRDGVNVFSREWDVCLVLDACRTDLLAEVADEYEWLRYDETIWSVGATSPEWIERTFGNAPEETLRSAGYVTWNAHSTTEEVDPEELAVLDEVWAYGWDDEIGAIPPENVTDRAVAVWRERDLNRMVVHYMQPHVPFISRTEGRLRRKITLDDHRGRTNHQRRIWADLEEGIVSHDEVWDAYVANLRLVLDDIEQTLLNNLDAEKVVITSDHGNGMSEWGLYGHGRNQPFAALREVPWCTTTAVDDETYTPELEPETGASEDLAQERLEGLGYL